MPEELKNVCGLFEQHSVEFVLFKCEHIFNGQNKNLDVLFPTRKAYNAAAELLVKEGFILYHSEDVERYKRMYIRFTCTDSTWTVTAVHLHREIAWHGVIALDARAVCLRATNEIPSVEDSLLIHTAHALFENFTISPFHTKLLKRYRDESIEWDYIWKHLQRYGWRKEFKAVCKEVTVTKKLVLESYFKRALKHPSILTAISVKGWRFMKQRLSLRRKGHLISLIGVNGAGKSTTRNAVLDAYKPLTDFASGQVGYYFGWKQSALSKVLSPVVSSTVGEKNIFTKVSKENVKRFDLFQEMLFLYNYTQYLYRYVTEVYPLLRRNKLIVTDRYFYDLWGQYPYSQNSKVLRILPFPKPDTLFVLDASVENLVQRDKTGADRRIVQPTDKLEGQRKRYEELRGKKGAHKIDSNSNLTGNVDFIIHTTWKQLVK